MIGDVGMIVGWLAAALGLVAAAALATTWGRRRPDDVAGRGVIVLASLALATIAAGSIWTWGGALATAARAARLAHGATVHLELAGAHRLARAGDVLLLGDATVPGVPRWAPPDAPTGAAVLAIPADPTACATWRSPTTIARATADGCELRVGPFTLIAVPVVPEPRLVIARATGAIAALASGPLLALAILAGLPRRHRRAARFAAVLRVGALAALLTGLVAWRLAWAYRVDVMLEVTRTGARVTGNLASAIAIGATFAGVSLATLAHAWRARLAITIAAWAATLGAALGLAHLAPDRGTLGVGALALGVAMIPMISIFRITRPRWLGPEVALGAITIASLVGQAVAPRAALGKLGLAYATVLAGYAALRVTLAARTPWPRRAWLVGALATTTLALARYDAGVAVAIAGTGLALAMISAGHDATYEAAHAARLGLLEREHARLVAIYAGAACILAIGLAAAATLASDRTLRDAGWTLALHAPLAL
ncbi:MAG: hypothetical protein NT062_17430, partial [Proteobacteria bacterium]|nr:hypothetical protein [Pseudomonadota bacterium]